MARSYFGARHLASRTGRFTTVDHVLPMEDALLDPQRWNRYSYVMNRPLVLTEPDARRDGGSPVVTNEQRVRLPGWGDAVVQTIQRHTLLDDRRLQLETSRSTGGRSTTTRDICEGAMTVRLSRLTWVVAALVLSVGPVAAQTPPPAGTMEYYHVDALGTREA